MHSALQRAARNMIARHVSAGRPDQQKSRSPEGATHMSRKLSNVIVHLVFGTKSRQESIPSELLENLWAYLSGIGSNTGMPVLRAGGITDHVHILTVLPTETSIAKAVQVFKANSSRWIREHGHAFRLQEGYGAFSVSASNRDAVVRYIAKQAEHHAKRTYNEEIAMMFQRSEITENVLRAVPAGLEGEGG